MKNFSRLLLPLCLWIAPSTHAEDCRAIVSHVLELTNATQVNVAEGVVTMPTAETLSVESLCAEGEFAPTRMEASTFNPIKSILQILRDGKFSWLKKLNPLWWLGNADEPEPPAWYAPGKRLRKLNWYLRNPFHNFTFYVIGFADAKNPKELVHEGKFPGRVFAPQPGWNYTTIRYKQLVFPLISYWDGKVSFYIGWREAGNFGLKVNLRDGGSNPYRSY